MRSVTYFSSLTILFPLFLQKKVVCRHVCCLAGRHARRNIDRDVADNLDSQRADICSLCFLTEKVRQKQDRNKTAIKYVFSFAGANRHARSGLNAFERQLIVFSLCGSRCWILQVKAH